MGHASGLGFGSAHYSSGVLTVNLTCRPPCGPSHSLLKHDISCAVLSYDTIISPQVHNFGETRQTVGWSVSCWDSNFLAGEANCAFDSLAAAAAGQFAGIPSQILQTFAVLAAPSLRRTHEDHNCIVTGRRYRPIGGLCGPDCK